MDVVVWLRSLGLEEYEAAFRENKVDAAVLPKLTVEDLKDLGVAAVGDRRKLLEAIEVLRSGTKPQVDTFKNIFAGPPTNQGHYRRTPPSDGAVLGPRRLNGPVGPHGP